MKEYILREFDKSDLRAAARESRSGCLSLVHNVPKAAQSNYGLIQIYPHGAVIHRPSAVAGSGGVRGESASEMSGRSRRRLGFVLANSKVPLRWMVTLTYDRDVSSAAEIKRHLKLWLKDVRRAGLKFAWFCEFQNSGRPHFHVFLSELPDQATRFVKRKGKMVEVAENSGTAGFLVSRWIVISQISNTGFQLGGIVERLRSEDAAGRYASKEAAKRAQKKVPDGFDWSGRWWGCSDEVRQLSENSHIMVPTHLIDRLPEYKYVWDHELIEQLIADCESWWQELDLDTKQKIQSEMKLNDPRWDVSDYS